MENKREPVGAGVFAELKVPRVYLHEWQYKVHDDRTRARPANTGHTVGGQVAHAQAGGRMGGPAHRRVLGVGRLKARQFRGSLSRSKSQGRRRRRFCRTQSPPCISTCMPGKRHGSKPLVIARTHGAAQRTRLAPRCGGPAGRWPGTYAGVQVEELRGRRAGQLKTGTSGQAGARERGMTCGHAAG